MTGHRGHDVVVGIDPARDWYLPLAWAADEAQRRRLPLRPVLAVPPQHDTHHVDDTPGQTALRQAGADRLEQACVLGSVAKEARFVVLGT